MNGKSLIEVVPALNPSRGSGSELRYRLLLAALEAAVEDAAPVAAGATEEAPVADAAN
jgi:hypothetical protein